MFFKKNVAVKNKQLPLRKFSSMIFTLKKIKMGKNILKEKDIVYCTIHN